VFKVDYIDGKFVNVTVDMEVDLAWDFENGITFGAHAKFSYPCVPGPEGGLHITGYLDVDQEYVEIQKAVASAQMMCADAKKGDVVLNITANAEKISVGGGIFGITDASISVQGTAAEAISKVTMATLKQLEYMFVFEGTVLLGDVGSFVASVKYDAKEGLIDVHVNDFELEIKKVGPRK